MFDRVAIAFGAMVFGCGAGLVIGIPLSLIVGAFTSGASSAGALVFWKVPILLGLIFGVVGFISPRFAADWRGNLWVGRRLCLAWFWRSLGTIACLQRVSPTAFGRNQRLG